MLSTAQGALPRLDGVNDTESEHSDDSAGEKEAKRQRSEPTTPVSTSSRLPYEYDALMGITRVGTKEAEGFEEEIDTPEYHDATEEPIKREETEGPQELRSMGFQGGYGSSSLKECIELLNATSNHTPAPLDSGVGQISTDPPHKIAKMPTLSSFKKGGHLEELLLNQQIPFFEATLSFIDVPDENAIFCELGGCLDSPTEPSGQKFPGWRSARSALSESSIRD